MENEMKIEREKLLIEKAFIFSFSADSDGYHQGRQHKHDRTC